MARWKSPWAMRYPLFTREDSDAFWRALLERFGRGVCIEVDDLGERPGAFLQSPGDLEQEECWIGFPDSSWEPKLTTVGGISQVVNLPDPGFCYRVSHEVYKRERQDLSVWEKLAAGWIMIHRDYDDPDQVAFIQEVFKSLNSVSSSRLVICSLTLQAPAHARHAVPGHRVGYHAARWALENNNRYFGSHGVGGLLRPADDTATKPARRRKISKVRPKRKAEARHAEEASQEPIRLESSDKMVLIPQTTLRSRTVFFTREDSHAFGEALKACFPFVAFCSEGTLPHRQTRFHVSLGELEEGEFVIYLSDETGERGQDLRNSPHDIWTVNPPRWRISYSAVHDPRISMDNIGGDELNLAAGSIGVQVQSDDPEDLAFAERVKAILDEISTGRLRRVSPDTADNEPDEASEAPSDKVCAGHHAVRWCLKDERRVMGNGFSLLSSLSGETYRPVAQESA